MVLTSVAQWAGYWRSEPKTQERQRGFAEDHTGQGQCQADDDMTGEAGQ